jgi:hypothetical protein
MFWIPIKSSKNYDQDKHIMSTLGHLEIKINNTTITLFKQRQKYVCFVFSIRLNKTLCGKKNRLKDTNAKLNALVTHFRQIIRVNGFLPKKMQDSPKTLSFHIILSKKNLKLKNFKMDELNIFGFKK